MALWRISLVFMLVVCLLVCVCDGKKTKTKKKNPPSLIRTAQNIEDALDPAEIIDPSRKFKDVDLAKLTEESIVNEHVRLSTQLVNWLNRVVDVGKGIANGVCRTVKLL